MPSLATDLIERKARPAMLRFEVQPVEDREASVKEGRYIAKDVEFVWVKAHGGVDDVCYKVTSWLKNLEQQVRSGEFPQPWFEQYQQQLDAWRKKQEIPLFGTPIKGWSVLSPAQQENLLRVDIRTVEDLAAMNDEGATRLGMGSLELKNKAKAWMAQAQDKGKFTQEMAALQQTNAVQAGQIDSLMRQVEEMRALLPKRALEKLKQEADDEAGEA